MKEAVEIAKLRLFLKLVATVELDFRKPNMGLEPLPDIDFNIRAGNTLVGFANLNDVIKAVNEKDQTGQMGLVFDDEIEIVNSIKNKADDLAHVFKSFKNAQLGEDLGSLKDAKDKLINYKNDLNEILNEYLAFNYGIEKQKVKTKYQKWLETHQPFHWFAEFYEIVIDNGGFDVIIGNPPYVVYNKKDKKTKLSVSDVYKLKNFKTIDTGNLFSFVAERTYIITNLNAKIGLIIPLSAFSIPSYSKLQELCFEKTQTWISNFSGDAHPAELFTGVNIRLSIIISGKCKNNDFIKSTKYFKFYQDERAFLFQKLIYCDAIYIKGTGVLKINNNFEHEIYRKYQSQKQLNEAQLNSNTLLYYHAAPIFWTKAFVDLQFFSEKKLNVSDAYKDIRINSEFRELLNIIINSNLFFYCWIISSDCYNLTKGDISKIHYPEFEKKEIIIRLSKLLTISNYENCNITSYNYLDRGEVNFAQFYPKKSKSIIDEIDKVLAQHYGFTDEELDFIINYDIKYRMGKELEEED